jgi:type I restriction enzyme R subunit
LGSERRLRSKRDLIEQFIDQHMPMMPMGQTVTDAFNGFWDDEKSKAISEICAVEKLDLSAFKAMIEQYHFSGKKPLQGDIVKAMPAPPKILERKSIVERIGAKLMKLVATFDEGIGSL